MISKIYIVALVLMAFLFVGCQSDVTETVDDDTTTLPDSFDDEVLDDSQDVVLDVDVGVDVSGVDSDFEHYLRFSVALMCDMFERDVMMSEDEANAFAQSYGFDSMDHAELVGLQYQGVDPGELYVELIEEKCPSVLEFMEAFAEEYS